MSTIIKDLSHAEAILEWPDAKEGRSLPGKRRMFERNWERANERRVERGEKPLTRVWSGGTWHYDPDVLIAAWEELKE